MGRSFASHLFRAVADPVDAKARPTLRRAVDYRKIAALSEEFYNLWSRLQAFYLDAVAGFAFVRNSVEAEQAQARMYVEGTELDSEEFQDTRQFNYAQIFSDGFCTSGIHRATQGQVKARNSPNGENFTTLGQLCIVAFYDYWNDYLRREYVIAKGHLDPSDKAEQVVKDALRIYGSHDLWGDLYYLRTAIVHNRGIATSSVAKCKLIKWFNPGDLISITPERMRAIFLALLAYNNQLYKERFPDQHIVIVA